MNSHTKVFGTNNSPSSTLHSVISFTSSCEIYALCSNSSSLVTLYLLYTCDSWSEWQTLLVDFGDSYVLGSYSSMGCKNWSLVIFPPSPVDSALHFLSDPSLGSLRSTFSMWSGTTEMDFFFCCSFILLQLFFSDW